MEKLNIQKKKIILTTPIALISLELYFGILFGYLAANVFAGKEAGEKGTFNSLVFSIGNWKVHLHHWVFGAGILAAVYFFSLPFPFPQFSFGFLGGLIFQGIYSYPDWRRIVFKHSKK